MFQLFAVHLHFIRLPVKLQANIQSGKGVSMRTWQGKPYYSLSQSIKNRVKTAVSYISDFEKELVGLARAKKCDGVICGHIHHPANTFYEDIHYLNSGDWVETLSALTEDEDGNWTIRYFDSGLLKEDNHKEKQTISITIAS